MLGLVIFVAMLCNVAFGVRTKVLTEKVSNDPPVKSYLAVQSLDVRSLGYTRTEAGELLDALGPDGRRIYAWTEVTLDLVFPFVYGLLFAIPLVRLYEPRQAWVLLFPLAGMAFDLLENVTVATLAWTYQQGQESGLATAASAFTRMKTLFLLLSLLLVLVGGVRGLGRQVS